MEEPSEILDVNRPNDELGWREWERKRGLPMWTSGEAVPFMVHWITLPYPRRNLGATLILFSSFMCKLAIQGGPVDGWPAMRLAQDPGRHGH